MSNVEDPGGVRPPFVDEAAETPEAQSGAPSTPAAEDARPLSLREAKAAKSLVERAMQRIAAHALAGSVRFAEWMTAGAAATLALLLANLDNIAPFLDLRFVALSGTLFLLAVLALARAKWSATQLGMIREGNDDVFREVLEASKRIQDEGRPLQALGFNVIAMIEMERHDKMLGDQDMESLKNPMRTVVRTDRVLRACVVLIVGAFAAILAGLVAKLSQGS